ncbi:hypothetical protein CRN76_10415 [Chryseobacterium indologenes]|uniref:hypothetical protein n=1 Tax=Chryseobacterium indologenes TaxID=253 RepID=UPI000BFC3038|nr:hypothetical protein [Chryseobacterium indologenes]ATN05778.1 hypothetical protein CRN76_10415 [Chryseobacterium indologenes]AYY85465.1 hypothetical protein EGX91_13330 [Chryseobacterium indologenes]TLX23647.1 hypothetical protein FE904_21140 [Chryseobacterium indologenes]
MKTILITGASTGLGRAATLLFQSEVGRLRRAGSGDFGEQGGKYSEGSKYSKWYSSSEADG